MRHAVGAGPFADGLRTCCQNARVRRTGEAVAQQRGGRVAVGRLYLRAGETCDGRRGDLNLTIKPVALRAERRRI